MAALESIIATRLGRRQRKCCCAGAAGACRRGWPRQRARHSPSPRPQPAARLGRIRTHPESNGHSKKIRRRRSPAMVSPVRQRNSGSFVPVVRARNRIIAALEAVKPGLGSPAEAREGRDNRNGLSHYLLWHRNCTLKGNCAPAFGGLDEGMSTTARAALSASPRILGRAG